MEIRYANGTVFRLNIRHTQGLVSVISSALLQDTRTSDIGINRLAVLGEVIMPEFLVFCLAFRVLSFLEIADQNFLERSQRFRIFRAEAVVAIQLHNIVHHDDKTRRVYQTMIDVDIHTVISFRHAYHRNLNHRNIRVIEFFESLLLQVSVRFFHGHVRQVQIRNFPVVPICDILLYISIFIRCRKTEAKAFVTLELVLDASFEQIEINLKLQTGKDADVAATLGTCLPYGQILQHLSYVQGIKCFFHLVPPIVLYQLLL